MRPASTLIWLLLGWLLLGAIACFDSSRLAGPWLWTGGILGLVMIVDAFSLPGRSCLKVERKLPGRFALGEEEGVELKLTLLSGGARKVRVFDEFPAVGRSEAMPLEERLVPGRFHKINYPLRIVERGEAEFGRCQVAFRSALGLWSRVHRFGEPGSARVYPNYEPVVRFALLAMDNRIDQMGIVSKHRAGMSREFQQLRDYHEGDTLSQIDWKATARRMQVISREYREQRDQTVIFLLDCGRRMRAVDGDYQQFDHCLNAMLLLSYVALRQGDQVGILGFGGEERWLPPLKGVHSMSRLLNYLYDFKATPMASDYSGAVRSLLTRQRRRSLVVTLTNLRGEDRTELVEPMRLLRSRHLVSVGSLREETVNEILGEPVVSEKQALTFGAAQLYLDERREVRRALQEHGIPSVDEAASRFPVALANHYLEIKSKGLL